MGLKEGAISTYDRNAATHQVYADIKGVWTSDRSRAYGRYFILGTEGSEFIVTDGKGIYKTGAQIIVERLTTEIGQAATTQIQTIAFSDEATSPKLQQLVQAYPNAAIYISGAVTVDMPDEVKLIAQPNQFQAASLAGSTLTLTLYPIESDRSILKEQYITGTLTLKIISPRPQL